jgi:membrane-bound metal-dependent hydrolase YbcI (DUF457 family)
MITRCLAPWPSLPSRPAARQRTQLAVAATLTAGAGILPDLDEPGSTIARTFGFLTGAFAWIVHQLSGGHRKGTHSLLGLALLTIAALWAGSWQRSAAASLHHGDLWWHLIPAGLIMALLFSAGLRALYIGGHHGDLFGIVLAALVLWKGWDLVEVTPWHVPVLAVSVALGTLAHVAGDMLTHDGCPLLYPVSRTSRPLPEPSDHHQQARRAPGHLPPLLALPATSSTATPPPPRPRPRLGLA